MAHSSVSACQGFFGAGLPKRKCSTMSSRMVATPTAMMKLPMEDTRLGMSQPSPVS